MAIEALIIVSCLKDESIARYLTLLCIHDRDEHIRYTTAKSLVYFLAVCCQQVEQSSHQNARKTCIKKQMQVILDIWEEHKEYTLANQALKYHFIFQNILKRLKKLIKNFIQQNQN